MKAIKFLSRFFMLGIILISTGCENDDLVAKAPTSEDAVFTYTFDSENPNKVIFTATPNKANWYTHWSFGDNSSAEGYEATKIFLKKGDYDVRFKIFTEGGVAESIQTIVINQDFQGPNILQNGEFNGSEHWTVLPISDGVNVSFENGAARWTGGAWGQVGIYQPINVLANNLYQISMDIKGGPLQNSWFEVYVGKEVPVAGGPDYADGGMRLSLNTWEGCGGEPFDGDFADYSCVKNAATFRFPTAGVAYIVIRGGGENYGNNGVTIDNVAIRSLESTEVLPSPLVANFSFQANDLAVSFTNSSANATTYVWDFGDNTATSTDENPTHTYAAGGIYNVKLTASNDTESKEVTMQVTVIDPAAAPIASFTVVTTNLNAVFTNTSSNASSYVWDFGDNIGTSTVANPTYSYTTPGTYTVKLTATKNGVSDEFTRSVTATADPNLVSNGSFNSTSGWTIVNQYEEANKNGAVTIANGIATFTETTSTDWKHMGIYTAVELQAGTYQFDMNMTYAGINDVWGEVYIGKTKPVAYSEYNGDQQVLKAYNAWDCGTIKTYSGKAAASGCDTKPNPGRFVISTAGTYYLLFRTGGGTYGANGIVIDNVSVVKI